MKLRLSIYAFTLIILSNARGQVASHVNTLTPKAENASVALQPVGRPIYRVNGAVLTDRDLAREMFTIFPYARQHNGAIPAAMEPGIREGATKMMIFEELVYQEAKRRKMTVSAARMQRGVTEFQKQFSSQDEFQQFLDNEFRGDQQLLKAKIERSLLIDEFLQIEVNDKAVVSVAEAKAYYDRHPERFRIAEAFQFQSISILPPQNATEAQLKEAHKRANDALRQAKATNTYEQFGVLAERLSDDDFRVMMGDHQTADRSKLPSTIVEALLAMHPGDVSEVIEFAPNAFTILRLNAHVPAGKQTFAAAKDDLREQLTKDKTETLRSALDARLTKNAKIEKL